MSSVPTHSASSVTVCSPCGVSSSNDKNNVDDDDSATTLSSPIPSSTHSSPGSTGLDNRNAVPIVVTEHLEISAASALQQLKQQQQQHVPPPPPLPITTTTTTTNVGELVNKAKKAAASLWMILHAQNCRQHKCHHRGCAETRLLLIHVKSCPAASSTDYHSCPTCTKGCNETRKLLAHYRKCKDIRTRQMMGKSSSLHGRRSLLQPNLYQGSSCLICSLVARYAKGMLDSRPRSSSISGSSSGGGSSSSGISSLLVSASLLDGKLFHMERQRRGLSDDLGSSSTPPPRPTIERTPSMTLMPPPPPRSGSCPTTTSTTTTATTNSILRRSSFTTLDDNTELIVLPDSGVGDLHNNNNSKDGNRLRAGSYDERQSRRVKFAPGITMNMLEKYDDDPQCVRPRSASCSNSGSSSSSSNNSSESSGNINNTTTTACGDGVCEAIVEEDEGYVEQPMFSMDL